MKLKHQRMIRHVLCFLCFTVWVLLGFTVLLHADPVTIDFTNPVWASANFQNTITVGNVTLTANLGTLWQDPIDGIGIRFGYENDEIEGDEVLGISTSSSIIGFRVSDFFNEGGPSYLESLLFSLDGLTWETVLANIGNLSSPVTNGEQEILLPKPSETLWLRSPGLTNGQNHEHALQQIMVSVPESSTLVLLGMGVLGLAGLKK